LYDKRISHEVEGENIGDEFKGYIFRISGGNDKQGFPMLQGVLTSQRVRLLFSKGMPCFRPRKRGERKRKSVRGCIVSGDLSVLSLVIVKKGDADIPGLTDEVKPRRLGPKRASKIRKLFNLEKKDDVRQYVIRRQIVKEGKKPITKAPKIQRLVTPQRLQHKRERKAIKKQRYTKSRAEAEVYNALLAKRTKESREKRKAVIAKKRSVSRAQSEATKDGKDTQGQDTAKQGDKKQEKAAKGGDKKQEKGKAEPKKEAKEKKPEQPKPEQPKPQQQPQQKDKGDKGGKGDKDKGGDKGDKDKGGDKGDKDKGGDKGDKGGKGGKKKKKK